MSREELKAATKDFLQSLEKELTSNTPPPAEMRTAVREISKYAKNDAKLPHMRSVENAFLYHYAVPIIFQHMQTVDGIGKDEAEQALLSEFYRNLDISHRSPARTQRHPFTKMVGTKPAGIIAKWTGAHGNPLTQACPDFAFREPFPFKIVFEGKYFEKGAGIKAQTELATNIYQAFYYRGLPYVPSKKHSPAWDYDFACLLAYDASDDGGLKQAWDDLHREVRRGFWEGANVYVMILRGTKKADDRTLSEQSLVSA